MKLAQRNDEGLAFINQYENIAWYEDGTVRILDRRIYPIRTEFVTCIKHEEVAQAIADMVTQSEGPYVAAAMGMSLAMHECMDKEEEEIKNYMKDAAYILSHARPTTSEQMKGIVRGSYDAIVASINKGKKGQELVDVAFEFAYNYVNNNFAKYTKIGRIVAEKFPEGGTIMTHCYPGTIVGTMLRECRKMNKTVKVICSETRPYYQGARLTASVACDMGFDTTVITDNMPASTMQNLGVDVIVTASDVITMDGHIVNKVGTFQCAMAAKYFHVPYYCTGTPDPTHKDMSSVIIEQRDPKLVLESMGLIHCMEGVKGYYPAFDVTPPEFCTGIVTDKGVYKPSQVYKYFEN